MQMLQTPVGIPQLPDRGWWDTARLGRPDVFEPGVLQATDAVNFTQCSGCGQDGNFWINADGYDSPDGAWLGKVWTHEDAITILNHLRPVMSPVAWARLYQQVRTANWFPDFTQLPAEPPRLAPDLSFFGMNGVMVAEFGGRRFMLVWNIRISQF